MGRWWQPEREERRQRDYYRLLNHENRYLWAFRDTKGDWFIHGIFA